MGIPLRERAPRMSQRIASASLRSVRNSVGTWIVAPPTRLGRTSTAGVALRRAC